MTFRLLISVGLCLLTGCASTHPVLLSEHSATSPFTQDLITKIREEAARKSKGQKEPLSQTQAVNSASSASSAPSSNSHEKTTKQPQPVVHPTATSTPVDPRQTLVSPDAVEYDVKQVLGDLSSQSGVPLQVDDSISGIVTIHRVNIPLTQALEEILIPLGGTYRWMGTYFLIGGGDPKSPTYVSLSETELYRPKNVRAADLKKLIPEPFASRILVDEKRNMMTVTGDLLLRRRVINDLAGLDRPVRQILIEAVIADLTEDGARAMGLDWNVIQGHTQSTGSLDVGKALAGASMNVLSSAVPARQILANIKMLEETKRANLRAAPRLTVNEGEDAKIFLGVDQYFPLVGGNANFPTINVVTIQAGTTLELVATTGESDKIFVTLKKAEAGEAGTQTIDKFVLPLINKRSVSSTVATRSAKTISIAGLQSNHEKVVKTSVPFLGSIPLLGKLFQLDNRVEQRTELVVFLTPYLLDESPEVYHAAAADPR